MQTRNCKGPHTMKTANVGSTRNLISPKKKTKQNKKKTHTHKHVKIINCKAETTSKTFWDTKHDKHFGLYSIFSHHGAEVCSLWTSNYNVRMSQRCWIYTLQRRVPKWRQQFFTNDNHLVFMFNNNHKNVFAPFQVAVQNFLYSLLSSVWKIHLNLVKINLWDFQITEANLNTYCRLI